MAFYSFCTLVQLHQKDLLVKNHESDPSISCEVDPSFVPKNQDHLEEIFNMNTYFCVPYYYLYGDASDVNHFVKLFD